jgi:hypothetical protein
VKIPLLALTLSPTLLVVSCSAPEKIPHPDAARFARPAAGLTTAEVIPDGNIHSPWKWSLPTAQGTWLVNGRYAGAMDGDRYEATITFPDGTSLPLPVNEVTRALYANSDEPELSAWTTADGTTFLSLGGMITLTRSEGIFAIKNQKLIGWLTRERTEGGAGKPAETSEKVSWFASPESAP